MLKKLYVQNIALIRKLELSFEDSLVVLSGETGAGKSLIVDALNFILGAKADKTMLTTGEKSAKVEAMFEVGDRILPVLTQLGAECEDGNLLLSRTLDDAGKSECRINGRLVTAGMLRTLGAAMVDIHGQHEHQSILKVASHLQLVDNYAPHNTLSIKKELSILYSEHREIEKKIGELGGSVEERARTMDFLKYQTEEIERAALSEEEEETLVKSRLKAVNLERLTADVTEAFSFLNGDDDGGVLSVSGLVAKASVSMASAAKYDEVFESLSQRAKSVYLEMDDIVNELADYLDDNTFDPKTLERIEKRLDIYKELKRKYGATVIDVRRFYEKSCEQYTDLLNGEELLDKLRAKKKQVSAEYYTLAQKLSAFRKQAAASLEAAVGAELHELGMEHARFSVVFQDFPDAVPAENVMTSTGLDSAEFYFSANKGEPPRPLSKVISGGEMSRFMLAIKVVTADIDGIETMVFDEIDTGISGKIGEVVAMKLAKISRRHQVLCVTHLSSIAAMADQQFLIYKETLQDKTYTRVLQLDGEQQVAEISRLVGGAEISSHSLAHSKELKDWSNRYKAGLSSKKT